jgi:hypothetical protein
MADGSCASNRRALRSLVWAALTLCSIPSVANAMGYKDGCPSFDPRYHTDFGVDVRSDTSLTVSRVGVSSRATHVESGTDREHLFEQKIFGTYSTRNDDSPHGLTLHLSYDFASSGDDGNRWGNLVALAGYRYSKFIVANAARLGWAIRLGTGLTLFEDDDALANHYAARLPFNTESQGYEQPFVVSGEARVELVGCTAGFLYLRLDNATWRAPTLSDRERIDALSLSFAIGGYSRGRFGIAIDVGVQWGLADDRFIPDRITRVGTNIEMRLTQNLSAYFNLAALSGAIEGVDASVRLHWRLR